MTISLDYLVGLLSIEDKYASEQFVLDVDGLPCVLENELLYNALQSLPDQERRVILYDFWYGCKDREHFLCRREVSSSHPSLSADMSLCFRASSLI